MAVMLLPPWVNEELRCLRTPEEHGVAKTFEELQEYLERQTADGQREHEEAEVNVRLANLIFIAKGIQAGRSSAAGNCGLPLSKVVAAAGTK